LKKVFHNHKSSKLWKTLWKLGKNPMASRFFRPFSPIFPKKVPFSTGKGLCTFLPFCVFFVSFSFFKKQKK